MDADTREEIQRVADAFFDGDVEQARDAMKATGKAMTYDATAPLLRKTHSPAEDPGQKFMHSMRGDPYETPDLDNYSTEGLLSSLKEKGKNLLRKGAAATQKAVGSVARAADKRLGKLAGTQENRSDGVEFGSISSLPPASTVLSQPMPAGGSVTVAEIEGQEMQSALNDLKNLLSAPPARNAGMGQEVTQSDVNRLVQFLKSDAPQRAAPYDEKEDVKRLADFLRDASTDEDKDADRNWRMARCGVESKLAHHLRTHAVKEVTRGMARMGLSGDETLDQLEDRMQSSASRADGDMNGATTRPFGRPSSQSAMAARIPGPVLTLSPAPTVLYTAKVPGVSADVIDSLATMASPMLKYVTRYADRTFFEEALQVFETAANFGIISDRLMTSNKKITPVCLPRPVLTVTCLGNSATSKANVCTLKIDGAANEVNCVVVDMPLTRPENFITSVGVPVVISEGASKLPLNSNKWKFALSATTVASAFTSKTRHQVVWAVFNDDNVQNSGIVMFRYNTDLEGFDKMFMIFETRV